MNVETSFADPDAALMNSELMGIGSLHPSDVAAAQKPATKAESFLSFP